jgi:hypothetical protein
VGQQQEIDASGIEAKLTGILCGDFFFTLVEAAIYQYALASALNKMT